MSGERWADEAYGGDIRIGLKIRDVLFDQSSPFQRVTIVDSERLGKALLLDGAWMTAEGDEKSYHEMLVHPVMTTATRISRVLVIGGGDGGTVREVLRYADVQSVVMVEIDELVVRACQEHLPTIGTAWDDSRLDLKFEDGVEFVRQAAPGSFDVIIVDGADPVGPAAVLFSDDFFDACRNALTPQGVLVSQAEGPNIMTDEHVQMVKTLRTVFARVAPYYGSTILYPGGSWSWVYATNGVAHPADIDPTRADAIESITHIWNRDVQIGALAMPNHIRRALS